MFYLKPLVLSLVLLFSSKVTAQNLGLNAPIPSDPELRKGVLENGLTYYIYNNNKPENRVSFYIYQNVGAILETDEQNGLAHFLEHMAFNGTKHFPGSSMLDMLERNAIQFGRDINAYTAHDETVYNISRVPSDNHALIDSCLLILHDWSDGLLLTEEELDKERGVISEEWRTRRTSSFRIRNQFAPVIWNNSIYSKRDVIGDLNVIKTFKPETIRDFYHDWYRTDLQAIAIVGNIDVDEIEKKVKKIFSPIPAIENPQPLPVHKIEENKEPLFVVATDEEASSSSVTFMIRHKDNSKPNLQMVKDSYISSFFSSMARARISEVLQKKDAPFLSASMGLGGFVRGYKLFTISAGSKEGEEEKAFKGAFEQYERIRRYGFTQAELDRVVTNTLTQAENTYKNRDQITNDDICKTLKNDFILGIPMSSPETSFELTKLIVASITLQEINDFAKNVYTEKNQSIIISGPDKPGIHMTKDQAYGVIKEVQQMDIQPYSDAFEGTSLLSHPVKGGTVIAEKRLADFDAVEWTLSNQAKVIYRHADFEKERIELVATSYGGSSLYEVEDLPSLGLMSSVAGASGLAEHDQITLSKLLTGKSAASFATVSSLDESVRGSSNKESFETMMQLVYLRFTQPRFDKEMYDIILARSRESLRNKMNDPNSIIRDTITQIITCGHPRSLKVDETYLANTNFERMQEIYAERFADASDFTFFIVGDIEEETAKEMAAKYLGALKDIDRDETWVDRQVDFPKGRTKKVLDIPMVDKKSTVLSSLMLEEDYDRKELLAHAILGRILRIRYTENIREKEGGTYGVSVSTSSSDLPEKSLSMFISFDCDPDKAEHLNSLVIKEFDNISQKVTQDELTKVVSNMVKNYEQEKHHNAYWMGVLRHYYKHGENKLDPAFFDEIMQNIKPEDISKVAKKFFDKADRLNIIVRPAEINQ